MENRPAAPAPARRRVVAPALMAICDLPGPKTLWPLARDGGLQENETVQVVHEHGDFYAELRVTEIDMAGQFVWTEVVRVLDCADASTEGGHPCPH